MTRLLILLLMCTGACLFLPVAWKVFRKRAGVRDISVRQLKEMLRSSHEKPLVLDVRTGPEYSLFHIPGSRSEPHVLLHPEILDDVDKSRPIVVA